MSFVHEGFCSARPSLIRRGRTRPFWEPAFPTLAATLRFSGFPTLANSPRSNSSPIGLYGRESGPFGPSQRILDLREFAAVEFALAEPVDSRPRPLSIPVHPKSSYLRIGRPQLCQATSIRFYTDFTRILHEVLHIFVFYTKKRVLICSKARYRVYLQIPKV